MSSSIIVARIGFVQCPGVVDSVQESEALNELLVAMLDADIILGGEIIVQFFTVNASAKGGLSYDHFCFVLVIINKILHFYQLDWTLQVQS